LSDSSTSSSKLVSFVCCSCILASFEAISFSNSEDWLETGFSPSTQVDLIHNSNKSRNHHQIPAGNVNATFFESSKYFQLNAFTKLAARIHSKIAKTKTHIHLIIGINEINTIGNSKVHNPIACFK
jgi:hypothetical protein